MGIKVLIAAAGTGGHVYPAIALADFLKSKGAEVFFLTSDRGEREILERKGYTYKELSYRGFYRRFCFQNVLRGLKLGIAFLQCISLLMQIKPNIVLGMGGYGEVPPILAGKLLGIKTLIHEQDVIPGLSTRLLARFVDKISLAYEETLQFLRESVVGKCVVTGNPVREEILRVTPGKAKKKWGFEGKKVLLAFGGSLGAKTINDSVLGLIREPAYKDVLDEWGIILITGKKNFKEVKQSLADLDRGNSPAFKILPYIDNIWDAYEAADLVLSRAGANTIAELEALGLPAILVPYPYSTANHQFFNARILEKKGQAIVLEDSKLNPLELYSILKKNTIVRGAFRLKHRVNPTECLGKVVLSLV